MTTDRDTPTLPGSPSDGLKGKHPVFLGAWLGGLSLARFGDYSWMWHADIALALVAAVANLPIREARLMPRTAVAAA